MTTRRDFLRAGAAAAALPLAAMAAGPDPLFRISLAEWSLHRRLYGRAEPRLAHLDFPKAARDHGIDAVEYVSTFFKDEVGRQGYLAELKKRCEDLGVRSLLIMVDGEGDLGDPAESLRLRAVENHRRWLAAAESLGCHAIRVNAKSTGTFEEQQKLAADGLRRLAELGEAHRLDVLVENHGGLSSNGAWLAGTIRLAAHPRCGTLPDFGNFDLGGGKSYDRYRGVAELMPFARAVSAKSHAFDASGEETRTDFLRMLRIVVDAGYRGHVGIEYEGDALPEDEGIRRTKALLERVRDVLAREKAAAGERR